MPKNDAFWPYAKHTSEVEDIINSILDEAQRGNTDFTIEPSEYLCQANLDYIESEVSRRYNNSYGY